MYPPSAHSCRRVVALGATVALTAGALAGCGSSGASGSPAGTITTFLNAAAAGDGATACAQLSTEAQAQVVQGASCEQGIKLGSAAYGSIVKRITIVGLTRQGNSASGTAALGGQPTATFQLTRTNGRWRIVAEHRISAPPQGSAGPSASTVTRCLARTFGAIENFGSDSTGGVPHVVLAVDLNRLTVAEVNVFGSSAMASSAYPAIKAGEGTRKTTLVGSLVIVYLGTVPSAKQRAIELCG
jgi:hypothetical protein